MAKLGNYITRTTYGRTEYECAYCYKTTKSLYALQQHCRDSPSHAWCHRCERVFRHDAALRSHRKYSGRHNICQRGYCNLDFWTHFEWENHNVVQHDWCRRCNWFADDEYDLMEHNANEHFMCRECGAFFQDDNNRRMHMITHQDRDLECYGCYRMFPSFSSMLIHLEAGHCCTSRKELIYLAANHYDSDEYFVGFQNFHPFKCPECQTTFRYLSGLYQHAEMRPGCCYLLNLYGYLDELKDHLRRGLW